MKKPKWLLIAEGLAALLPTVIATVSAVVLVIQESKNPSDEKSV